MTTAARPTFESARGGNSRDEKNLGVLSKQYSARDLPGHTSLKYRQTGQGTSDEHKAKDFRRELEERERAAAKEAASKDHRHRPGIGIGSGSSSSVASFSLAGRGSGSGSGSALEQSHDDPSPSSDSQSQSGPSAKRLKPEQIALLDADDPSLDADTDDESDDEDDDEDDTAELLAELQRIKRERAQEEAKREADQKSSDERIRMENVLSGNPLLNMRSTAAADGSGPSGSSGSGSGSFKVKRRWDDDVVFKNCARGEPERKGKNFINDTLRSDFHRKFMEKYIK